MDDRFEIISEEDEAYLEWLKLPHWKKYEGDRTPLDYQGYDSVCPEDKLKEE